MHLKLHKQRAPTQKQANPNSGTWWWISFYTKDELLKRHEGRAYGLGKHGVPSTHSRRLSLGLRLGPWGICTLFWLGLVLVTLLDAVAVFLPLVNISEPSSKSPPPFRTIATKASSYKNLNCTTTITQTN